MEIKFNKLQIENFGCFTELQILDLKSIPIGVCFVRGVNKVEKRLDSNGSGKSTLINALCWALYGKTSSGLKSTDIKPWNTNDKPKVEVTLRLDDKKYAITRTAPNFMEINGGEVGQEDIDLLLRMSYLVFKQTVLFGQQEQLFYDLTNRDKLTLLSDVLELDRWEIRAQKAGERVRELEATELTLKVNLAVLEASIETSQEQLEEARTRETDWEEEVKRELTRMKKARTELKEEVAKTSKALASKKRVIIDLSGKVGKLEADLTIIKGRLERAGKEQAIILERRKNIQRQQERLTEELEQARKSPVCPTCGQSLKDKKEHRAELVAKLKADIANLDKELVTVEDTELAKTKERCLEEFTKTRVVLCGAQQDLNATTPTYARLLSEDAALSERLTNLRARIEECSKDKNPYTAQIVKHKADLVEDKAKAKEVEAEREKLGRRAARAKYWVKGFKDVRLFIVEDVLTELELTTNALLEEVGLIGWNVRYAVERETKSGTVQTGMTIDIISPSNKDPVKWESWSGGEGQRLRLAGALALSEVLLGYAGINVDLEILDEPTKHLDEGGALDLCEMLAVRADQVQRRVIYIDHMVVEGAHASSTITVTKTKNGATLNQE